MTSLAEPFRAAPINAAAAAFSTCYVCHRPYVGTSKPRWVFDMATGAVLGSQHTSCRVSPDHTRTAEGDTPVEAARFLFWRYDVYAAQSESRSDDWFAAMLGDDESSDATDLSDRQREMLDWWTVKGGLHLGEARRQPITDAYWRMLKRYREWRSALDAHASE